MSIQHEIQASAISYNVCDRSCGRWEANRDVQSRCACRHRVLETPTGNAIDLMRRLGVFAGRKVHFEEKNGQ
jgi:hypothetical protein